MAPVRCSQHPGRQTRSQPPVSRHGRAGGAPHATVVTRLDKLLFVFGLSGLSGPPLPLAGESLPSGLTRGSTREGAAGGVPATHSVPVERAPTAPSPAKSGRVREQRPCPKRSVSR